jgi:hypothetical protein
MSSNRNAIPPDRDPARRRARTAMITGQLAHRGVDLQQSFFGVPATNGGA